jgi:2-methylisocitrate lyase-like PEP mutase family enzyme
MSVTRDELVEHVARLVSAMELPLNVDAERCFADDTDGVAETVRLLAEAGASGCSIEDLNPAAARIDDLDCAAARVAAAADAARESGLVLTARCEHHLHGVDDLEATIIRLGAYCDAGADVVYAPGLVAVDDIRRVVDAAGVPVNVLALPGGPTVAELAAAGGRVGCRSAAPCRRQPTQL